MAINSHDAIELIKAAVESGSIKLRGTTGCGDTESAEEVALIDSAYLKKLYSDLKQD
jgi:hypothetical protein